VGASVESLCHQNWMDSILDDMCIATR